MLGLSGEPLLKLSHRTVALQRANAPLQLRAAQPVDGGEGALVLLGPPAPPRRAATQRIDLADGGVAAGLDTRSHAHPAKGGGRKVSEESAECGRGGSEERVGGER